MVTMMPSLPSQVSPSKDGFSRMLVIGTSLLGGGSTIYVVVQLIREEPAKAFDLANRWGPGYLLALFIAFLVDRLIRKMIDSSRVTADSGADAVRELAVQVRSVAEANSRQASAMQAMADRDDRDKQEMQTLIGVVNSKVDQTLDEIKRQNRSFERIENALKINSAPGSETT
jgi:hypothetical protein